MVLRRFCVLFLLVSVFLLTACVQPPADPLAYQKEAACLLLEGKIDGFSFAAELVLKPLDFDAEGRELPVDVRDFTLTYTAPHTLNGLTLVRCGGEVTLLRGDVSCKAAGALYSSMLLPAMLFCIDCEMGEAVVVEQDGTRLNWISASDDEGQYQLWLDQAGYPRRIEAIIDTRSITVDIQRCPCENEHIS